MRKFYRFYMFCNGFVIGKHPKVCYNILIRYD